MLCPTPQWSRAKMPAAESVFILAHGAISAVGPSAATLWRAALAGDRTNAAPWRDGMAVYPAGEAPSSYLTPKAHRRLDRCVHLAASALEEAMTSLPREGIPPDIWKQTALLAGSGRGPAATIFEAMHRATTRRPLPTQVASSSLSSLSGNLAAFAGVEGIAFTLSAACASGALAIATAAGLVAAGGYPMAIAGGADAPLHPGLLELFAGAGVLGHAEFPSGVIRPCQTERTGTALGEGAAFLVLAGEAAANHAAPSRALPRIIGWGTHQASGERQKPGEEGEGLAQAIESAFHRAGLHLNAIDGAILHATGTAAGDAAELAAVKRAFGEAATRIPFTAIKPVTGHCVGASGALEAVVALRALADRVLPPVAGFSGPAVEDIDFVTDTPRPIPGHRIATFSSGFWGGHACLIFEAADPS